MDADDERLTDWGASRRTYYGGDTADLEIGQKDEDAVEEEALARAQQRGRWRRSTRTTSRWTVAMTMRWRRRVVICLRPLGGRRLSKKCRPQSYRRASSGGAGGARRGRRAKCDNLKTPTGAASAWFIMRCGLLRAAARAEGIDATQHPVAQRLPIALRSLEASAITEAPETVAKPTPAEEAPQEEDDLYAASQERRRKKRQKYEVKPRFGS